MARSQTQRRRSRRRLSLLMFAITAIVLTGFVLVAYGANAFRSMELDTVDARFTIRGTQKAPKDVVVVAIDDVTFGALQQRWPFPRRYHARVIRQLAKAGAKVPGSPGRTPRLPVRRATRAARTRVSAAGRPST